jgi:membrane-bound ClpP family serine protease
VKRLIKFLHTIGAIGLMGATASLLALMSFSPPSTSLAGYALMRGAMAEIATWIFFPSFSLTLIAGLLAIAVNPAYHTPAGPG